MSRPATSPPDAAITIALRALAHLAGTDDLSARFLAAGGLAAGEVAVRAADPEFLAAVLDFYLGDEGALVDFATAEGLAPEAVMAARRDLPGGALPHWT